MRTSVAGLEILVLLIVFSLVSVSPNAAQKAPQMAPPIEQLYKMPAVYSVPNMDKVQIHRNIVYKTLNTPSGKIDLKMDVYVPSGGKPSRTFPFVLLISGGGIEGAPYDWRDAEVYTSYGRILGASGFIGVSFSKRYARGVEGVGNGIEDTNTAIRYLQDHAAEFHADPSRYALWAFSAGGLILSMTLRQIVPTRTAVLCFYCVTDIDTPGMSAAEADRARLYASPLYNLRHRDGTHAPPIFVARAGLDSPDLNNDLDQFITAALKENLALEVMNHPTGRHGFDILDPDGRSRKIIRSAIEFLKTHLAGPRKTDDGVRDE
jgi:acetyl esterase/lipase